MTRHECRCCTYVALREDVCNDNVCGELYYRRAALQIKQPCVCNFRLISNAPSRLFQFRVIIVMQSWIVSVNLICNRNIKFTILQVRTNKSFLYQLVTIYNISSYKISKLALPQISCYQTYYAHYQPVLLTFRLLRSNYSITRPYTQLMQTD